MYPLFRKILFRFDPESAHDLTLKSMRVVGKLAPLRGIISNWFKGPEMPLQAFGLQFRNPIGLAAGYDKDGMGWRGLICLGFGHIELGTVTLQPQDGNPRPRLFRLPEERGLINRMGFPGRGSVFVVEQIKGSRAEGIILGVNIGKNKNTPLESAADDYLALMEIFAPLADYLVVNVSSPNTIGLRRLQARQALNDLLVALAEKRRVLSASLGKPTPLLVKLSPDLTDAELDDALEVMLSTGMDGVIATNTTIGREGIRSTLAHKVGGLSGAPLRKRSTQMVRDIYQRTGGKLPIVGVGGVDSAEGAREKLDAGASLVQVYSGLVYEGPGLVKKILIDLNR